MRSVVIDFIRERQAERRGGDAARISLTNGAEALVDPQTAGGESEILRVHEALETRASVDPRLARVVEMRYFGGLTEAEIAGGLEISDRTVRRDWEKARLLLRRSARCVDAGVDDSQPARARAWTRAQPLLDAALDLPPDSARPGSPRCRRSTPRSGRACARCSRAGASRDRRLLGALPADRRSSDEARGATAADGTRGRPSARTA